MSDLISRSELLNAFNNKNIQITFDLPVEEVLGEDVDLDDFAMLVQDAIQSYKKLVIDTIKEHPTAYSVDEVVKELEYRMPNDGLPSDIVWNNALKMAIEIVKQGGVTKDCNNCANYAEPDEVDNGCYLCCKGYENNYEPKVDNGGISDDVCEWRLCDEEANVYDTSCRNPHILIEGTPKENNYEYCPYCGKKIKIVGD